MRKAASDTASRSIPKSVGDTKITPFKNIQCLFCNSNDNPDTRVVP